MPTKRLRKVPSNPDALLNREELAQLLGCSVWVLGTWWRKGLLPKPIVLAQNAFRWRQGTISAWLLKMEAAPYQPPALRGKVRDQVEKRTRGRIQRVRIRISDRQETESR